MSIRLTLVSLLILTATGFVNVEAKLKALIIDGQNNHGMWPMTTVMMKQYLEETGLFTVDVERTAFTWQGADLIKKFPLNNGQVTTALEKPKSDPNFKPKFSNYDVVITNFGWNAAPWPAETKESFQTFVRKGGGLVVVHAADNSFGDWDEYNRMIGLGGWGDRDETHGPYVYYNDEGKLVRDNTPGRGGSHGSQHEFQITIRDNSHPITHGMPSQWLHAKDELYDRLRGPAEEMHVLATTYSSKDEGGTGRHEPMLMTIKYGDGRIFHTPMGHADYSMECVGFILTLTRGTEWAATGKVTQTKIPEDFPAANKVNQRKFTNRN